MAREGTYKLKAITNSYVHKWGDYDLKRNELVRVTGERVLATKQLRVSRFRIGGTVVALVSAFGRVAMEEGAYIRISGGRLVRITRSDRRVELTQYKDIHPGDMINISLMSASEDRIPVVTIEFEPYVKGEYKKKSSGIVLRRLFLYGTKRATMGIREPRDTSNFWPDLYRDFRDDVIDEFMSNAVEEHDFDLDSITRPGWVWTMEKPQESGFKEKVK